MDVNEEDLTPENYTRHVTDFHFGSNGDGYEFRSEFSTKITSPNQSWNIQVDGIILSYPLPLRYRVRHQFTLHDQHGDPLFMVSYQCGPDEHSYTMGWHNDGSYLPETYQLTSCPFTPDTRFTFALQRYVGDVDALQYSLSVGARVTSRHLPFTVVKFPDASIDRIAVSGRLGVDRIVHLNAPVSQI